MIHLRVRRFFCRSETCRKTRFAEQVPGLTTRYGRWTNGLEDALRAVALALGGRAGARLAGRLAADAAAQAHPGITRPGHDGAACRRSGRGADWLMPWPSRYRRRRAGACRR